MPSAFQSSIQLVTTFQSTTAEQLKWWTALRLKSKNDCFATIFSTLNNKKKWVFFIEYRIFPFAQAVANRWAFALYLVSIWFRIFSSSLVRQAIWFLVHVCFVSLIFLLIFFPSFSLSSEISWWRSSLFISNSTAQRSFVHIILLRSDFSPGQYLFIFQVDIRIVFAFRSIGHDPDIFFLSYSLNIIFHSCQSNTHCTRQSNCVGQNKWNAWS